MIASVAYTLIATRTAFVFDRILRNRNERALLLTVLFGAAWPFFAPIYGLAVFLLGDAGIYGERREHQ